MRNMWLETINIKPILEKYEEDEIDVQIVKDSAQQVSKLLLASKFSDCHLEILCDELCSTTTLDGFNAVLGEIYDWADRRRVWLGI